MNALRLHVPRMGSLSVGCRSSVSIYASCHFSNDIFTFLPNCPHCKLSISSNFDSYKWTWAFVDIVGLWWRRHMMEKFLKWYFCVKHVPRAPSFSNGLYSHLYSFVRLAGYRICIKFLTYCSFFFPLTTILLPTSTNIPAQNHPKIVIMLSWHCN